MKLAITLNLLLLSVTVFAQKSITVNPDSRTKSFYKDLEKNNERFHIDDIKKSAHNAIRIWYPSKVQTILNKDVNITQIYQELDTKQDYLFNTQIVIDSTLNLTIDKLKNLEAVYPLDCLSATIEIIEDGHYFIKSVGCNNEVGKLTFKLNRNIIYHSEISHFVNQLPSGNYIFGMSRKFINRPLENSEGKSDLYRQVENKLAHVGIFPSDNIFKQPAIFLDDKQITYQQLNTIISSTIKKMTVMPADLKGDFLGGIMLYTK